MADPGKGIGRVAEGDPGTSRVKWGLLGADRFWMELPDGRMFAVDGETRQVVLDLMNGMSPEQVAWQRDIEEGDVQAVADLLAAALLPAEAPVSPGASLDGDWRAPQVKADGSPHGARNRGDVRGPGDGPNVQGDRWVGCRGSDGRSAGRKGAVSWAAVGFLLVVAILCQIRFAAAVPPRWVTGLVDQWLVAGALTLGLVLHEAGHWLATPRDVMTRIRLVWFGPVPVLSLVNTGLWKWPLGRRIAVDVAGAGMDLAVAGAVAGLGLIFPGTAPYVWSFLVVHWIRMGLALIPLFHGDGYFLMADLLGRPNLWAEAVRSLRARRFHWLSLYALVRFAVQGLAWIWFWAWVVQSTHLLVRTGGQGLAFLVHPAVVWLYLSAAGQVIGGMRFAVGRWRNGERRRSGHGADQRGDHRFPAGTSLYLSLTGDRAAGRPGGGSEHGAGHSLSPNHDGGKCAGRVRDRGKGRRGGGPGEL